MPQAEFRGPRLHRADTEYSYRRHLRWHEMLPAIGVGIGVGLLAFYVARLLLQRTPLGIQHPGPALVERTKLPPAP